METQSSLNHPVPVDEFKRRTIRSWYIDGVWDLALAGFFALTAIWIYPLVRTQDFPSWTWPWPFQTTQPINPMQTEITLWAFGTLVLWFLYIFAANWLANMAKHRFVAPRIGEAKFQYFLPVERRVALLYVLGYFLGSGALAVAFYLIKGGPHLLSVFFIVAPAAIVFLMGAVYHIRRWVVVSAAGLALGILLELLTTNAIYNLGPRNFFDVSILFGNPSISFLVWAVLFLASGVVAFSNVLRLPYAES